ncbi:hypothetical protein LVD13_03250 [Flavobacteriaceae bacterium D16]|nr:hypothetical protein [Flavobacteriaceae bacterium D16]
MISRPIHSCIISFIAILLSAYGFAQEPKLFSRSDFDLKGEVKNCLVITNYGQEEFEFNQSGLLSKSITRFTEEDYSVTYYKYRDSLLLEQRNENYAQGQLDEGTSIAHFYALDTSNNRKITERIFSYQKEFLDQYEYYFDEEDRLIRVIRSNEEGVDETEVTYTTYKDEQTITYSVNGVIQKSIRKSIKGKGNPDERHLELTKEFLGGQPNRAVEVERDPDQYVLSSKEYYFDPVKNEFALRQRTDYEYDAEGNLNAESILLGRAKSNKSYIYQFDGSEFKNWIKQVVTPDNTYKTRRITYFDSEPKTEEK